MADDRKITIEIIGGDGVSDSKKGEDAEEKVAQAVKRTVEPLISREKPKDNTSAMAVIKGMAFLAVQKTANLGRTAVNNTLSRYNNLKEDYMAENTMSAISSTVNVAKSFKSSVVSGATAGSAFGPVGTLVGTVIGTAYGGVNLYLNEQARYSSHYQNLNATNYQTQFAQMRAGLIDNGRGTEN